MKFISILLTVYTLSLSIMPCADGYSCSDEEMASTMGINAEHSSDEEDFCSPFCVCACCSQSVWVPFLVYETTVKINNQQDFVYQQADFSSQIQSIWQPPKLS